MSTTDDPSDPRLTHGVDPEDAPPKPQAEVYLVLSEQERKDFIRPVRYSYTHTVCGGTTTMNQAIAETYAQTPAFYGSTYCAYCGRHRPVGPDGEFYWEGTNEKVGT